MIRTLLLALMLSSPVLAQVVRVQGITGTSTPVNTTTNDTSTAVTTFTSTTSSITIATAGATHGSIIFTNFVGTPPSSATACVSSQDSGATWSGPACVLVAPGGTQTSSLSVNSGIAYTSYTVLFPPGATNVKFYPVSFTGTGSYQVQMFAEFGHGPLIGTYAGMPTEVQTDNSGNLNVNILSMPSPSAPGGASVAYTTGTTPTAATTGTAIHPTTDLYGETYVVGSAADGTAIAGSPVQIGAAVVPDGTTVPPLSSSNVGYLSITPDRRLYVDTTHPAFFSCAQSAITANAQCNGLSGSGLSYYIDSVTFSTGAATNISVVSSTTAGTACASSPVTVIPVMYFQNTTGGGGTFTFPSPVKATANSALCCTVSATNASSCLLTGHIAP